MRESPSFSVVSTILNDRAAAAAMISDLLAQTLPISEFVAVDGGSSDGTWEYLQAQVGKHPFAVVIERRPKTNVAQGRNRAIELASHELIVSTDFGCRLEPTWAAGLVRPFAEDPTLEVVHGSWKVDLPQDDSGWQWAELALNGGPLRLVATADSLGSSRSQAYTKSLWRRAGGYPEDLTLAADDVVFSLWVNANVKRRAGAPDAVCSWHRFETLRSFLEEQDRYGLGAGEALVFRKDALAIGSAAVIESTAALSFVAALVATVLGASPLVLAVGTGVLAIGWLRRLRRWLVGARCLARYGKLRYAPLIPVLEVGRRYRWLRAYARGVKRGETHCQDCRQRVAGLS